jgi:hypothetical protein
MGVLSAVESAWTARFINAAGPDLEPREDAFPCLRLIEHIATRTTGVREAAMLGFSQHCGTGFEQTLDRFELARWSLLKSGRTI